MPRQEKTEAPTPRRRQEARRRGQVARSIEVNSVVVILAGIYSLSLFGRGAFHWLLESMQGYFTAAAATELSPVAVGRLLSEAGLLVVRAAGPVVGACLIAGVVASLAQVGLVFSFEQVVPRLSRLDPAAGIGRIFSGRSLVELVKASIKVLLVGYIGYSTIRPVWQDVVRMAHMELASSIPVAWGFVLRLALHMGMGLAILSLGDYIYQRREFEANLRMTREEVKEEFRQTEGDPFLRSRIRARQRQIAMRRMMQEVPKATVVVTNPTEIAVALKYDPRSMPAPRVVAKGLRLMAMRIKEIASKNGVPIVENKPLAWSLYKAVEVGEEIPPKLYRATAEILAYIYRLSAARG